MASHPAFTLAQGGTLEFESLLLRLTRRDRQNIQVCLLQDDGMRFEVLVVDRAQEADAAELLIAILRGHLRELRRRPTVQEILRWELNERNALTATLAREREQRGLELLASLPFDPADAPDLDLAAVAAIVYAGLTHVVLRAKTTDH